MANYGRIKVWGFKEDVLSVDVNAEFDNLIDNDGPQGSNDYSETVLQMQATTDPGSVGSESLATSLAGEIERLRFVLSRLIGETNWYDTPDLSIDEINSFISGLQFQGRSRIISGKTRGGGNNQPLFLEPEGSGRRVFLRAAATDFVVRIDGTTYTEDSDLNTGNLALAPAANNTALVDDVGLTLQEESRYAGEPDSTFPTLTIDTAGTEITSLIGKYAAFKHTTGGDTEIFLAYVKSATQLTKVFRGYTFNSSNAPAIRITLQNNDTLTLLKTHWIFYTNTGVLMSTANAPFYDDEEPVSAAAGDYWFDFSTGLWKIFSGGSFVNADSILIGLAFTDSTNCIGVRSFEFFAAYDKLNTIDLEITSVNSVSTTRKGQKINVSGQVFQWTENFAVWDMASDLTDTDGSTSQAASTRYYIYVTDYGDEKFSTIRPWKNRLDDLYGYYHPHSPWRCVGYVNNDGSSDFIAVSSVSDTPNPVVFREANHLGDLLIQDQHINDRVIGIRKLSAKTIQTTTATEGNIARSVSSASFTTSTTGSEVDVTGLTTTITSTGRPLMVMLIPDGSGSSAHFEITGSNLQAIVNVKLYRGATLVGSSDIALRAANQAGGLFGRWPPQSFSWIDNQVAGTYTYKVVIQMSDTGGGAPTLNVNATQLLMYEI